MLCISLWGTYLIPIFYRYNNELSVKYQISVPVKLQTQRSRSSWQTQKTLPYSDLNPTQVQMSRKPKEKYFHSLTPSLDITLPYKHTGRKIEHNFWFLEKSLQGSCVHRLYIRATSHQTCPRVFVLHVRGVSGEVPHRKLGSVYDLWRGKGEGGNIISAK